MKDMSDLCASGDGSAVMNKINSALKPPRRRKPQADGAKEAVLPPIRSAAGLSRKILTMPPEVIAGVLHAGSTMVFGGGSKTYKTFCLMDLAYSVSEGLQWWGFETQQGKVLYIDFELQVTQFEDRLKSIIAQKDSTKTESANFDIWSLRGHAADLSLLIDHILEGVKDQQYSLIIIDPIYKALGDRDENSAGHINSLMNEVDKLATATGAAIVIGHHYSKGNQAGKESMDRISGSGVFGRSPDAILVITRHQEDDTFTVDATLRNFRPIKPFCVKFEYPMMKRDDKLDPKDLKKAGAAVKRFTAQQLLDTLGTQELTTTCWASLAATAIGMSIRVFYDRKKELVDSKQIEEIDGKKWRAVTIAKLPPTDQTQTSTATADAANAAIAVAAAA